MKYIKYYLVLLCFAALNISYCQIAGNPYQKKLNPNGITHTPFVPPPSSGPVNPGVPGGNTPSDLERRVFWVHGLNGDNSAWTRAQYASEHGSSGFPGRKLQSIATRKYTQDGSIFDAGSELYGQFRLYQRGTFIDTLNFIVAHSQGGIVSRSMAFNRACLNENYADLAFGGIVTFGTPHGGAQILNNKDMIQSIADETCRDYLAGPWAKKIYNNGVLRIIFSGRVFVGDEFKDTICNRLSNWVFKLVLPSSTPNITNSYKVGAKDLEILNNVKCESDIDQKMRNVAFYGIENPDGLMFRTNKYFFKSPNISLHFEANRDQDAVDEHKKSRARYLKEKKRYERTLKILKRQFRNCKILFGPVCGLFYNNRIKACKNVITGYEKGVRWHDRIDDQYKTAIGALTYQKTIETGWCKCFSKWFNREFKIDNNNPCSPDPKLNETICTPFSKVIIKRIYKDNDGVVLAESASAFPNANIDDNAMRITSHMQMRNNIELKDRLYRLYEGQYGDFFYTNKR